MSDGGSSSRVPPPPADRAPTFTDPLRPHPPSRGFSFSSGTRAPWAFHTTGPVRRQRITPQPTPYQLPRMEPSYRGMEPSHRDTPAPWAVPRPGAVRGVGIAPPQRVPGGPRDAPRTQCPEVSRALREFFDTRARRAAPPPETVRGPSIASPQRVPSGPRVAPQAQFSEVSRAIRSFVDTPSPWATPPQGILHGPRVAPSPTHSQLPGVEPLDRDTPAPLNVRRPGAVRALSPAPSAIPHRRPIILPHTHDRASRAVSPPRIPTVPRIAYRSTPEEISRGFPPFQILSAPWAVSPPGPPFEPRTEHSPSRETQAYISQITPSTRHETSSRDLPSENTPLTTLETSRQAQLLQTLPSIRHEMERQSRLYDTRPSTGPVNSRRVLSFPPRHEVPIGAWPLQTTLAPGAISPAKENTTPVAASLPGEGATSQNSPSSKIICTPHGGIDLFWTPEDITPADPEWEFPARLMQDYYDSRLTLASCEFNLPPNTNITVSGKDEKQKVRATNSAKVTHLEEKLLDRACYELDILGDASFMEQLFGMTLEDISAKGWKTAIFEGPITSFESRYTKLFNIDMNDARLQNRHLRNHRHARRLRRGRVYQLPEPPKTQPCELPPRKTNAAPAQPPPRLEGDRSGSTRGPTPRPPRVSEEIAGEARLGKPSVSQCRFHSRGIITYPLMAAC